jgi:hypothetical protein
MENTNIYGVLGFHQATAIEEVRNVKNPADELRGQQRSVRRASMMLYVLAAIFFAASCAIMLSPYPFFALASGLCLGGLCLFCARDCVKRAKTWEQAIALVSETQPQEREIELFGKKTRSLVWLDKENQEPRVVQTASDILFSPKGTTFPHKATMSLSTSIMLIVFSIILVTCCVLQELKSLGH